jgi:hypothetical protein
VDKVKKNYYMGDDLFVIIAFIAFMVAVVLKLLGISTIIWGVTTAQLFKGAVVCLLFSIALSLGDIARAGK